MCGILAVFDVYLLRILDTSYLPEPVAQIPLKCACARRDSPAVPASASFWLHGASHVELQRCARNLKHYLLHPSRTWINLIAKDLCVHINYTELHSTHEVYVYVHVGLIIQSMRTLFTRSVSFSKHGPSWNVIAGSRWWVLPRTRFLEVGKYKLFPNFCNNWQPGTKVSRIFMELLPWSPWIQAVKKRTPTSTLCTLVKLQWHNKIQHVRWRCKLGKSGSSNQAARIDGVLQLSICRWVFWERWLFHWDNDKSVTVNPVN